MDQVAKNTQFSTTLMKNWASTQRVKKDRIIRDLQFELARNGFAGLKKTRENIQHREEQEYGIDSYEKNLIKNGIGGGDQDSDRPLGVNHENGEQFLERIEDLARRNFPVDQEISGFLSQLKVRMKDRQAIRHEKARRRRKGAAEQSKAAQEEAAEAAAMLESTKIKSPKKNKFMLEEDVSDEDDDKATIDVDEGNNTLRLAAEESVRLFAEDFRSKYDRQSHADNLAEIMKARRIYQEKKRALNYETCRAITISIVDIMLNSSDDGQRDSSKKFKKYYNNRTELSEGLLRMVERQVAAAGPFEAPGDDSQELSMDDVATLDAWPSYAALAMNAGLWRVGMVADEQAIAAAAVADAPLEPTEEGSVVAGQPPEGVEADADAANDAAVEALPTAVNALPLHEPTTRLSQTKDSPFVDVTQTMLESLLTMSSSKDEGSSGLSLSVTAEERNTLLSDIAATNRNAGVVLVVGGGPGSEVATADVETALSWLGTDVAELWDVAAAIEVGKKIAPLLEGKVPTISYAALFQIFSGGAGVLLPPGGCPRPSRDCPEGLRGVPLDPTALRIAAEIVEASNRICASVPQPAATVPAAKGKGPAGPAPVAFTEVTFGILLGQVLWLRDFVKDHHEQYLITPAVDPSEALPVFAKLVLGGRCVSAQGAFSALDSASFALAVEWFLSGGTREALLALLAEQPPPAVAEGGGAGEAGILEGTRLLQEAVAQEAELLAGGGGKKAAPAKAAAKGKGAAEVPVAAEPATVRTHSMLAGAVRVLPSLPTQEGAELTATMTAPAEDASPEEESAMVLLRRFVASFTAACVPKSNKPPAEPAGDATSKSPDGVLIDAFAGLGLPLLFLRPASALAAPDAEAPPVSAAVTPGLSTTEALVSSVLLVSPSYRQVLSLPPLRVGEAASPEHFLAQVLADWTALTHRRREQLLSNQARLWLMHLAQTNPLDFDAVYSAHSLFALARGSYVELLGPLLMACGLRIADVQEMMRQREAEIISSLKAPDSRWQFVCQMTHEKLAALPARSHELMGHIASDCVCMLGSVIDDRHLHWLAEADAHKATLSTALSKLKLAAMRVSELLSRAVCEDQRVKGDAAAALGGLLVQAGYATVPWPLPHSGQGGSRRAAAVRKDRLRAEATQLAAACGADPSGGKGEGEGEGVDLVGPWRAAIGLLDEADPAQRAGPQEQLVEALLNEMRAEIMETSVSVLRSIRTAVVDVGGQIEEHHARVRDMVVKRFQYEHGVLREWSGEMTRSLERVATSSNNNPRHPYSSTLLSEYYFGASDEANMDHVPWKVGEYLLELGDLTIPFAVLRVLSEELRDALRSEVHAGVTDVDASTAFLVITRVMQVLVAKGTSLASSWTQADQVERFVARVLRGSASLTVEAFAKATVMALLLGAIPVTPPLSYISTMLQTFPERPATLKEFLTQVGVHKVLGKGWGSHLSGFAMSATDVQDVLTALVTVCSKDAGAGVDVDSLAVMMCMGSPLLAGGDFERTLLLHADVLHDPDAEHIALHDGGVRLPTFLAEGVFKALSLVATRSDQADGDHRPHRAPSSHHTRSVGVDRLASVSGPHRAMTPARLQWLMAQAEPFAFRISDDLSSSYRPTFGIPIPKDPATATVGEDDSPIAGEGEGQAAVHEAAAVAASAVDVPAEVPVAAEAEEGSLGSLSEGEARLQVERAEQTEPAAEQPPPRVEAIRPAGHVADFLELANDIHCSLARSIVSGAPLPFTLY